MRKKMTTQSKFDIRNSNSFVAAKSFIEIAVAKSSPLAFHAYHMTGEKNLTDEQADKFLAEYYESIGVDYENDAELSGILKCREEILAAINSGIITVNHQ